MAAVAQCVHVARESLKEHAKTHLPFVAVCHDVWDSNQKDALGLTVWFCSPQLGKLLVVPVGMEAIQDKTAKGTAKKCLNICDAVEVKKPDVCSSVNDTAATAKKVGLLMTRDGDTGTCHARRGSLAMDRAIGRKTRSATSKLWMSSQSVRSCARIATSLPSG